MEENGMSYGAIKTYVLRTGRMTEAQRRNYAALKATWCLPYVLEQCDFRAIFGNDAPVTVEIGFGMGTVTAHIAADNPDKNYIGIEVHKPGVGRLLGLIQSRALTNVRIIEHDAVVVLRDMIPDGSLAACHIFFPDPWPKKRHHKRRLIQRAHTALIAQKLAVGGYLYVVTDWREYAEDARSVLEQTAGLVNAYTGFAPRQPWRSETNFERKGIRAGRASCELFFVRTDG